MLVPLHFPDAQRPQVFHDIFQAMGLALGGLRQQIAVAVPNMDDQLEPTPG